MGRNMGRGRRRFSTPHPMTRSSFAALQDDARMERQSSPPCLQVNPWLLVTARSGVWIGLSVPEIESIGCSPVIWEHA